MKEIVFNKDTVLEVIKPHVHMHIEPELEETYYTFTNGDLFEAIASILLRINDVCQIKTGMLSDDFANFECRRLYGNIIHAIAKELTQ